jgi:hypothetical protein
MPRRIGSACFPIICGGRLSRDAVERLVTSIVPNAIARRSTERMSLRMFCATLQPWTFFNMALIAL